MGYKGPGVAGASATALLPGMSAALDTIAVSTPPRATVASAQDGGVSRRSVGVGRSGPSVLSEELMLPHPTSALKSKRQRNGAQSNGDGSSASLAALTSGSVPATAPESAGSAAAGAGAGASAVARSAPSWVPMEDDAIESAAGQPSAPAQASASSSNAAASSTTSMAVDASPSPPSSPQSAEAATEEAGTPPAARALRNADLLPSSMASAAGPASSGEAFSSPSRSGLGLGFSAFR